MAVEPSGTPRILIVRRDNIGDLVCTTPLIAALRERLPRAWIAALVNSYNAEVLARNPALDEDMVHGYCIWKTIYRAYEPLESTS